MKGWAALEAWSTILLLLALAVAEPAAAADNVSVERQPGGLSIVVRDASIVEIFEMLAAKEGTNVLLGPGVEGKISVNLFDVSLDRAIRSIAAAGGFAVERRAGTYLLLEKDQLGVDYAGAETALRSFKLQYTDTEDVVEILEKHLSRWGEITALPGRNMLVIEDRPDFLRRFETLLAEVDREPQQILLEAKILEITLDSTDIFGIDWSAMTSLNGEAITVGVQGLATGNLPGLFIDVIGDDFEGMLEALADEGRVRAMATPRLLTVEDKEAEVLIGDRLGFRVTTTINQVTTESVEFIDSGVILRFTPSVDRQGRVLIEIHPEVSTGVVTDGIPSVTTTEVTTRLLAEDGEQVFIGGLIRDRSTESRRGVPFLSSIPFLGMLFARSEWTNVSTETVVIVTPHILPRSRGVIAKQQLERMRELEGVLDEERDNMGRAFDWRWGPPAADYSWGDESEEGEADAPPAAETPEAAPVP